MVAMGPVDVAEAHGAKFRLREGEEKWIVLDQPGTSLWWAIFCTKEDAARAFCLTYGYAFNEERGGHAHA